MISKNALLRGVALGAMFAVAATASAHAKPVHKKKVAAATYGSAPSEM